MGLDTYTFRSDIKDCSADFACVADFLLNRKIEAKGDLLNKLINVTDIVLLIFARIHSYI